MHLHKEIAQSPIPLMKRKTLLSAGLAKTSKESFSWFQLHMWSITHVLQ